MIARTAGPNREFLRGSHTGKGLPRIENHGARAFDGLDEALRCRRRPGKRLQKIERRTLGGEDRAGLALDPADRAAGGNAVTIAAAPVDRDRRIELTKSLVEPGLAAEYGVVA
jgi:hypothetical protein